MRAHLVAGFLALAALIPHAHAADQTVLGRTLTVRDPSTPYKRRIAVRAKEPNTDDTLVGNPVAAGASVTITVNGATSSSGTYQMPAGTSPRTSRPFWTGDTA